MAESSPGPFFVKINYESPFAPHSMEIPTLNASVAILDSSHWNFLHPGGDTSDVTTDVKALVNLLKIMFPSTVTFKNYVLYSQPDPEAPATPVFTDAIDIVGTNVGGTWFKAVQSTFSFRTNEFGIWKLVLLDTNSENSFNKVTVFTSGETLDLIRDYVTNADSWILGRDGGKPQTALQFTKTLNEKLRRSYRMT